MNQNCNTNPKPKSVKEFFKSWFFWKPFIGIVLGVGAGLIYYYQVGCISGTCPITGSVWGTAITGGLMGYIVSSSPCATCK